MLRARNSSEHLTVFVPASRARRFLATPLHEIISSLCCMPRRSRREAFDFPGDKSRLGKRTLRMEARTNPKSRLPSRRVTEGLARATQPLAPASNESINAAVHLPMIDLLGAEIFKKTPCAVGLKPGGRYVAKDMYEVGGI